MMSRNLLFNVFFIVQMTVSSSLPHGSDNVMMNQDLDSFVNTVASDGSPHSSSNFIELRRSIGTTNGTKSDCLCTFYEELKELRCANVNGTRVLFALLETPHEWCNVNPSSSQLVVFHRQSSSIENTNTKVSTRTKFYSEYHRRVRRLCITRSHIASFTFDSLKRFDSLNTVVMNHNDLEDSGLGSTVEGLKLTTVIELDLRNNNLARLPARLLAIFPRLQIIRIDQNNLTNLEDDFFSQEFVPDLRNISMKDNRWRCDQMWWFVKWIRFNTSTTLQLEDPDKIECLPCEVRQEVTCFDRVTFDNFIDHCPRNCTCNMVRANIAVDCRNKGYHDFPLRIPNGLGILYMENNTIRSLQTLKNVSLAYQKLRYLYIDNNSIDSINDMDGINFEELTALHITGNRLRQLPVHIFKKLFSHFLDEVTLGNNPWNCECNTVVPFSDLLNSRRRHFKDIEQIRCSSNSTLYPNDAIYRLSAVDFCSKKTSIHPLDIINVLLATIIVLIVAKLVYDYRAFKRTGQIPACPYIVCGRK